jgi:exodeoxyribonuclease VII small subunit
MSDEQTDTQHEMFETPSNEGKESDSVSEDNSQTDTDESSPDGESPEDFQVALDRLKEVAAELESGELPLEEAMERYREGLDLIEFCEDRLEEAELLVEEIDDRGETPETHEKESPES